MYYILEIQQYQDGTFGHIVHYADTRNKAESKYHEVLAAAAISELPKHSAVLFTDEGFSLMQQTYKHVPVNNDPSEEEPIDEPVV